jgi:hypothetical protein
MIDDLVPCKHATDYEIARGLHFTREEDGVCNPCIALLDLFEMKRADAEAGERMAQEREAIIAVARANHPSGRVVEETSSDDTTELI